MSRIHEALKKAAQERSSHLTAGTLPDLADVAPGFESPSGLGTQVGEPAARTARTSECSSFLCFDDLLKRCAHPSWHLEARISFFTETDKGRCCGQRLRTLTSTLY